MTKKSPHIDEAFVDALLATTKSLFNNVHTFECALHKIPGKSHRGIAITYQDLIERRGDFVRELRLTLCSWVYSKSRHRNLLEEIMKDRECDEQHAFAYINCLAQQKLRKGFPQGQFGELLLFNLLQHFFKAAPILRKMPVMTSPNVERHGADAIHYRPSGDKHTIFLGEAKSYSSKYKFTSAVEDSVTSSITSYKNFSEELGNFVYEDFVDSDLRAIAKKIKNNELPNVNFELVCISSYEEGTKVHGANEEELKASISKIVNDRLIAFEASRFDELCGTTLSRLHLIVMPVWNFKSLLEEFEK